MRKSDLELNTICGNAAQVYINGKLDKALVDKQVSANSYAHGYYMGFRWREQIANRKLFPHRFSTKVTDQNLSQESAKCLKWYLNRQFQGSKTPDKELIYTSGRRGFEDGVRACEGQV